MSKKQKPEAGATAEKVTLEVVEKARRRHMEFETEEDRLGWERAFRKSKWYTPYFLVGVGVNFLLYRAGVDLAGNILWGMVIGTGIPMACMFGLTEVHYHLFLKKYVEQSR